MGEATKWMSFIFLIIFFATAEGKPVSAATLSGCTLKNFLSCQAGVLLTTHPSLSVEDYECYLCFTENIQIFYLSP
jgi:hypothetical protein